MEKKTKIEIIQETYDYYTANPNGRRSFNLDGECVYEGSKGQKCAFSRCCDKPIPIEYEGETPMTEKGLMEFLSEEYKGHEPTFWRDLQNFHDENLYWGEEQNKITKFGIDYYNQLLKKYS